MSILKYALNPSNRLVQLLVTPDGRLVTDQAALPVDARPISEVSPRVTADGRLCTTAESLPSGTLPITEASPKVSSTGELCSSVVPTGAALIHRRSLVLDSNNKVRIS